MDAKRTAVAITHSERVDEAVNSALDHLAVEDLVRGKVVAVKPNETWASAEDTSGVTQGDTLQAVLRYVKRFQPRELIVTGGAGAAETEDVFRLSGMMRAIEEEAVSFFDHNRAPFQQARLEYPNQPELVGVQDEVMVNPRVLEYETLISLAQLKMHATATVTLTMKNIAMSFPAADYYGHPRSNEDHANAFFDDMHSFIVAMVRRFPIHLGIISGHPAMIATGPLGGKAVETGLIIAGRNPVAVDTVGARLLGLHAQGVRHLWEAGRQGMGETDPGNMQICGLSLEEAIRTFTRQAYDREMTFQHA